MHEDVKRFVQECDVCQRQKVERQLPTGDMYHFEICTRNEQIALKITAKRERANGALRTLRATERTQRRKRCDNPAGETPFRSFSPQLPMSKPASELARGDVGHARSAVHDCTRRAASQPPSLE